MKSGIAVLLVGLSASPAGDSAFSQLQTPSRNQLRFSETPSVEHDKGKPTPVVFLSGLDKFQDKYSDKIAQLREGIEIADKFFGQEPGSRVKQICIHAQRRLGTATYAKPSSMWFHATLFNTEQKFKYQSFHEYVHLIDDESEWSLSKGRMDALHKRISVAYSEFFTRLAEKEFLPGAALLGHPEDNSMELVASLVNSLNHPELEDALLKAPNSFRQYYMESLEVLAEGLSQVKNVPKDAPIQRRTNQLLRFLASSQVKP